MWQTLSPFNLARTFFPWVSNDLQALLLGECNNCRHKLWYNLEQATC